MIVGFTSQRQSHQSAWADVLYAGLSALGVRDLGEDVAVCWGWRKGKRYKRQGMRVLVFERGYLGDRFRYTSLAWDGLNGYATFPEYPDDGGARFRKCGFELRPVRDGGDYVLIAGQVATDMAVRGLDVYGWAESMAKKAKRATGLPVVFRPHPDEVKRRRVRKVRGVTMDTGDLQESLDGAALVVTYNSNTGVLAAMNGTPVVAMNDGSMAHPVAMREIDGVCDWTARERWAHALAWKQWTMEEIASGEALRGIVHAQ